MAVGEPYHKIDSIYARDERGGMLFGQWARPEFGYLAGCEWEWTEKVDGTNIRVIRSGGRWEFRGRSDDAQIPGPLVEFLRQHFEKWVPPATGDDDLALYGEGYGWKIQKVGPRYRSDPRFVLFDVKVGSYWLRRPDVEDIGRKFGVPCVPVIRRGTLHEAVEAARAGYRSLVAEDPTLAAEGFVLRPMERLLDAGGRRIITKIKAKDFKEIK